jgi:hypothetical protein
MRRVRRRPAVEVPLRLSNPCVEDFVGPDDVDELRQRRGSDAELTDSLWLRAAIRFAHARAEFLERHQLAERAWPTAPTGCRGAAGLRASPRRALDEAPPPPDSAGSATARAAGASPRLLRRGLDGRR